MKGDRKRRIGVPFKDAYDFGAPDHFFHFMWGYLLPAIHKLSLRNTDGCEFLFRSCGPVMDALTAEAAEAMEIEFQIVPQSAAEACSRRVRVPRWDIWTLAPYFHANSEEFGKPFQTLRHQLRSKQPGLFRRLGAPRFVARFQDKVHIVRDLLLYRLEVPPHHGHDTGDYLILRRSEGHPFHAQNGAPPNTVNGDDPQALSGTDDAADALRQVGLPVTEFETGSHSLAEQAQAFHHCRGLAMMRGAEIANLVWMRPGTPVLVVTPESMLQFPPPHDMIAELTGIELRQVIAENDVQALDPLTVYKVWHGEE